MEKLQGPINPCLISEDLEVGNWLEEFISSTTANLQFEDPYNTEELEGACYSDPQHCTLPGLEDKMPFLQMLQTVEASHLHHLQQQQQQHQQHQTTASSFPLMQLEPNFQFLLRLQHQKVTCFTNPDIVSDHHHHHHHHHHNNINNGMIIMDLHSQGVKSECKNVHQIASEVTETQKCNSNSVRSKRNNTTSSSCSTQQNGAREKRKRKRATRPAKNKEEVETQRMTHIAVERNRRRQMNEHLNALRSLMPPSYAQRGDQASIIGGAIDFVKELEQMLQSLQAQKKMRQSDENGDVSGTTSSTTTTTTTSSSSNMFMDSSFPQLGNPIHSQEEGKGKGKGKGNGNNNINGSSLLSSSEVMKNNNNNNNNNNEEYSAEKKSALADIEVVVIQNHVNLKIQCQRRPGQLLKAIVAFEELRLTVLHLNITSLHAIVHYSFNLKIEDDCKLGSADEVARAVHQIFSLINLN